MENRAGGIDLHIHTTSSDGTRTVYETIQDAVAFGLSHIAITDHNQFAVLQPAIYQGLEIIPGAEFSTAYTTENGKLLEVHVVGLFLMEFQISLEIFFIKSHCKGSSIWMRS